MDEILELLNQAVQDFLACLAVNGCEGCVFLSKGINDNPNYCNRIDDMDEAEVACKRRFCPHYITFDKVKKMQDEYKQLRDRIMQYERDESLRNYGGRG